jgi:hypothetical protein
MAESAYLRLQRELAEKEFWEEKKELLQKCRDAERVIEVPPKPEEIEAIYDYDEWPSPKAGIIKEFLGVIWNITMAPEGYFIVSFWGWHDGHMTSNWQDSFHNYGVSLTKARFRDLPTMIRAAEEEYSGKWSEYGVKESGLTLLLVQAKTPLQER